MEKFVIAANIDNFGEQTMNGTDFLRLIMALENKKKTAETELLATEYKERCEKRILRHR
jgi:hypothetical protein